MDVSRTPLGLGAEGVRQAILSEYRRKTGRSAEVFARASGALSGGTTGNLRYFAPYPLYFASGSGSEIVDIDGNRYVDCFLGNGPLLLGHRHERVTEALDRHRGMGSLLVNPILAVDVAEQIQRTVSCAQRVRFLNSGTEAVLTAVRLARAFTGKTKVVKFLGHYHGQDDQFLVGLTPNASSFGAGIPSAAFANTLLVGYGDIDALVGELDRDPGVAAVILDPAMHSGGLWGSSVKYLQAVRDLTASRNVVLIFDEVITGFRLAAGGAQAFYSVEPDLAVFAKALGAGEKLAAVAGREELMRGLDPHRPPPTPGVFQSGTGNDGTFALAAAHAAIETYRDLERRAGYRALFDRSERLADGIRRAFRAAGVSCHVNQLGPMLQLFLSDAAPGFAAFSGLETWPLELFYLALINEGVLLSLPSSNHIYLSFAHTDGDIERVLAAVTRVLNQHDFGALVRAAVRLD